MIFAAMKFAILGQLLYISTKQYGEEHAVTWFLSEVAPGDP
jgi:hypothetical protein